MKNKNGRTGWTTRTGWTVEKEVKIKLLVKKYGGDWHVNLTCQSPGSNPDENEKDKGVNLTPLSFKNGHENRTVTKRTRTTKMRIFSPIGLQLVAMGLGFGGGEWEAHSHTSNEPLRRVRVRDRRKPKGNNQEKIE